MRTNLSYKSLNLRDCVTNLSYESTPTASSPSRIVIQSFPSWSCSWVFHYLKFTGNAISIDSQTSIWNVRVRTVSLKCFIWSTMHEISIILGYVLKIYFCISASETMKGIVRIKLFWGFKNRQCLQGFWSDKAAPLLL